MLVLLAPRCFDAYDSPFDDFCAAAGTRKRLRKIDQSAKVGLTLNNWTAQSPTEQAIEYWEFDWEYSQPLALSSWAEG